MKVSITSWSSGGKIFPDGFNTSHLKALKVHKVQCFPLYSILVAVGRTSVDYFSLDVEGFELKVLQTIPWDKVDIKVLTVEWQAITRQAIPEYMKNIGYIKRHRAQFFYADDLIFVKNNTILF